MTDQCNHCSYNGDLAACKAAECSKHKDWYPMQLQKELDELKASIPKIKADAVRGFANNMRDVTAEASLMGHAGIMQMSSFAAKSAEAYANQLEGKE